MGPTALRHLLESICSNSEWKYAVFWKLRHGSPTILTWEDGYFDYLQPRLPVENVSENCQSRSDILASSFDTSTSNDCSGRYPIQLLVADLSHMQYTLGEGVVGQVALMGTHCWLSFNDVFTDEVNPKLVPDCPEELLLQFASGIKTILLIPLLPHGVLQLGSLEEVAEDIQIVAYLKGRFSDNHNIGGVNVAVTLKTDTEAESSSSLLSNSTNYVRAPSATTVNPVKSEYSDDSMAINSTDLDGENLSIFSQILPLLTEQDLFRPSGKEILEALKCENDICASPIGFTEESSLIESLNVDQMELVERKVFELSCLMEELQSFPECTDYNVGMFEDSLNGVVTSYPTRDMAGLLYRGEDINDTHENVSSFLNFPEDSELHKALGPAFQVQTIEKWDSSSLVGDTCKCSSFICKDLSGQGRSSCVVCGGGTDLLGAVGANAYCGPDDISRSFNFKLHPNTSTQFAAYSQPQKQSKASVLVGSNSALCSQVTSEFTSTEKYANVSGATFKSTRSSGLTKETQRAENHIQPRKGQQKASIVGKRRVKPGDNQKLRPRDRQLIQDRVKELRELVPNGAKCSIDGLLDRTIKHMMYLRSVTEQADKLRQWALQEVAARKKKRASETKDNCPNGMSWALEFGTEPQICPIVVEDLASPGHMLIEMICSEHDLFLEIAQVIRGLDLTILKGEMESRSNGRWAHFIVEVSKGFHRLDIFWPLMQLLQRKRNPISSKI